MSQWKQFMVSITSVVELTCFFYFDCLQFGNYSNFDLRWPWKLQDNAMDLSMHCAFRTVVVFVRSDYFTYYWYYWNLFYFTGWLESVGYRVVYELDCRNPVLYYTSFWFRVSQGNCQLYQLVTPEPFHTTCATSSRTHLAQSNWVFQQCRCMKRRGPSTRLCGHTVVIQRGGKDGATRTCWGGATAKRKVHPRSVLMIVWLHLLTIMSVNVLVCLQINLEHDAVWTITMRFGNTLGYCYCCH